MHPLAKIWALLEQARRAEGDARIALVVDGLNALAKLATDPRHLAGMSDADLDRWDADVQAAMIGFGEITGVELVNGAFRPRSSQ